MSRTNRGGCTSLPSVFTREPGLGPARISACHEQPAPRILPHPLGLMQPCSPVCPTLPRRRRPPLGRARPHQRSVRSRWTRRFRARCPRRAGAPLVMVRGASRLPLARPQEGGGAHPPGADTFPAAGCPGSRRGGRPAALRPGGRLNPRQFPRCPPAGGSGGLPDQPAPLLPLSV